MVWLPTGKLLCLRQVPPPVHPLLNNLSSLQKLGLLNPCTWHTIQDRSWYRIHSKVLYCMQVRLSMLPIVEPPVSGHPSIVDIYYYNKHFRKFQLFLSFTSILKSKLWMVNTLLLCIADTFRSTIPTKYALEAPKLGKSKSHRMEQILSCAAVHTPWWRMFVEFLVTNTLRWAIKSQNT